jgi:transposase
MPRPPLRVSLDDEQRAELGRRLGQRTLAPRVRRRLEALRLADQGHTAPQIAPLLGVCEPTVRRALWRFRTGGLDALADRPIPGRRPTLSGADLDAVVERLRGGHARTVNELVAWLVHTRGVRISRTRLGTLLRQRGCRWTAPSRQP